MVIDTSGSMSSNFPKVVTILDKVGRYLFFVLNSAYKALEANQKQYSSTSGDNTSFLKFKHVVVIPVGSDGDFRSCPGVADYGDPCG